MNLPCDIHIHTVFSDGHYTPAQVVQMAHDKAIDVVAITDHDTVDGVQEGRQEAARLGMQCLSGIELSAYSQFEVHVLGYNVPTDDPRFVERVTQLQQLRRERIQRVVDKLHHHGVKLVVRDELDTPTAGRSHVAELLVKQGFVRSKAEAFDKYIGKGAPCYVEGMRISPQEAVTWIAQAGGVPVLAHPYRFLQDNDIDTMLRSLLPYGLQGIEVYYPNYSNQVRQQLISAAARYDLIVTGGSDFHSEQYGAAIGTSGAFLNEKAQRKLLRH